MKNILLALVGLNPQIITEMLYALHQNRRNVDIIHVITTRDGKEKIYAELLGGGSGYYYQYLKEYDINPAVIDFSDNNIHVIKDDHGIEIPDILTESDNELLLKKCLELAFTYTKNPETTVLFSVAGGRKTMSSCLTLAAQMYGRSQDRLYHVLVSPEFESNRNFFFPPQTSKTIELIDKQGQRFFKETKYVTVNLVHIPFFSIREQLSPQLLKEPKDPGTLKLSLIKEDVSSLTVNLIRSKIIYSTVQLDLMPARMALYAFFAIEKKHCSKVVSSCRGCTECFIDIRTIYDKQDQIADLYRKVSDNRPIEDMSTTGIMNLNANNFNMYKGKIKSDIIRSFGLYASKELEISSIGSRPNTKYGILMDKSNIEIVY